MRGMDKMEYHEMLPEEAERISEIDAECYIKNAWRIDAETNEYKLVEINWTDYELPNGFEWHLNRFRESISEGGKAFGCFDQGKLVGYGTTGAKVFGDSQKYVLLDQLFVSKDYRNRHVGRQLMHLCAEAASEMGAEKLYLCAGSSEDTIAFYKKMGCVPATEINEELFEEDPNDIQFEYKF